MYALYIFSQILTHAAYSFSSSENLIVQWFSAYRAQYEMIDILLLPCQGLHLADILKKLSQLWTPTFSRASTKRPSNQAVLSLIGTATCSGPRVKIQISKIVPRLPRNICNRLRRSAVTSSVVRQTHKQVEKLWVVSTALLPHLDCFYY